MILLFTPDGEARGLYSEQIDLREIGALTIERASCVEFNPDSQLWEVRTPTHDNEGRLCENPGELLFEHPFREDCLKWEREHFEAQL